MNIERMKFAYARGASIQWYEAADDRWNSYSLAPRWEDAERGQPHRIRPDHAHLEYGPLSSELRRRAIEDDFSETAVDWYDNLVKLPLWRGVWAHIRFQEGIHLAATEAGRMHMLFLAETPADEGL